MKLHCASGLFLNLDEPGNPLPMLGLSALRQAPGCLPPWLTIRASVWGSHRDMPSAVTLGLHMGLEHFFAYGSKEHEGKKRNIRKNARVCVI